MDWVLLNWVKLLGVMCLFISEIIAMAKFSYSKLDKDLKCETLKP